ncbi:hypothetical protein DAPPUDRAFT_267439 [Daphnia pulex]|uniref:Peptidase M13 C-terminal domain-containing protein n=1 Tax=Daphnia pulex TaxID=6669 RepID=E9HWH5_DAPPU|nr:hypothetical protein DAPPUDRAFT_267439 [Daphnia pulex]|eukprot:EFX63907.1 hypothetical protein DAPPUDRAFT_267439 [Daphnia pulex]
MFATAADLPTPGPLINQIQSLEVKRSEAQNIDFRIWCKVLNGDGYEKYTQEAHSPGKYRANGVLQNSPTFSQFFNCRLDSPMNPANKCQLWS